ncbi:hypothetical protein J1605_000581 [Eschrichtius robustus]|uniref:Uncharacterized protein n=1 Tax=Eschrichtius robustus TaxID=9764 RepID=A0AB34GUG6_ESCRO|nr:hypothetical protein J1605_000581 [Eschrichtius robustus]
MAGPAASKHKGNEAADRAPAKALLSVRRTPQRPPPGSARRRLRPPPPPPQPFALKNLQSIMELLYWLLEEGDSEDREFIKKPKTLCRTKYLHI